MIEKDLLRKKVDEVKRQFPWYGDYLSKEIRESFRHGDLPLMTAELLERHYYHHPPADDAQLSMYRTSGTSLGKRKSIYYDPADDENYIDIKTRLFGGLLRGSGVRTVLADMGTGHAANTALEIFRRLGLVAESLSFDLPIEWHIVRLKAFRPDVLYTMPSILDRIVQASHDPASYGIRRIILVGEIAAKEWQRKVAASFGLEPEHIIDTYGSIEIGTIAAYSHEQGRYLLAEGLFGEALGAEQLSEGFEPLAENEKVLVLTSFVRKMFPAIRFVTYDVVRDFETTFVDGVPVQSFRSIVKRIGPELKHGEKISVYDIEEAVYSVVDDAEVRVVIRGNMLAVRLRSRTAGRSAVPAVRQAIEGRIPDIGTMIRNGLLRGIEVEIAAHDSEEPFERGAVKSKKLYYTQEEERS